MYLVNFLSLQAADLRYIATRRYRTGRTLSGLIDGNNATFTVPPGDKFTHNLPYLSIGVYYNGVRLSLLEDYLVIESGGFGSGYDTVVLEVAPRPGDLLLVDYVALGP